MPLADYPPALSSGSADRWWDPSAGTGTEWIGARRATLLLVAFVAFALALQVWDNAYTSTFGFDADEPAHFVSGLMVRDYYVHGYGTAPMRFAEEYYRLLPKVAIGHWPPLYYVVEGAWFLPFGQTRAAALWLAAFSAGGVALLLTALLWDPLRYAAAAAGIAYLICPISRSSNGMVMPDQFMLLLSLGAVLAVVGLLESDTWRRVAVFCLLAVASLLTKPAALFIALAPVFAALALRDWRRLFRVRVLLAGILTGASVFAWYWYWREASFAGHEAISAATNARNVLLHFQWAMSAYSVVFAMAAFAGLVLELFLRRSRFGLAVACCVPGTLLVLLSSRFGYYPPRYYLPMIPALLCLAAVACHTVIPARTGSWRPVLVFSLVLATTFPYGSILPRPATIISGLDRTVEWLSGSQKQGRRVLVAGEADFEGAVIAQYASQTQFGKRAEMVRASKTLIRSNWSASEYRLLYKDTPAVLGAITAMNLQAIAIEKPKKSSREHHKLLYAALLSSPGWSQILQNAADTQALLFVPTAAF